MCEPAALAKGASSWWWSSAILQRRLQGGLNSAWWVAETWPFDLTKGNDHFSVSLLFPACFEPLSEAVVDSGTSLLAVPTPIFPELYEMLRRSVTKVFGEIGWRGFLSIVQNVSTFPRNLQFKSGPRLVQAVLSLLATYYIAAWLDAVLQVSCITRRGVFIVWTFVSTAISRLG